jgi:hypothetical protein
MSSPNSRASCPPADLRTIGIELNAAALLLFAATVIVSAVLGAVAELLEGVG